MILRYTLLYVDNAAVTLEFYGRAFVLDKAFLHPSEDHNELLTGETKLAFSTSGLMQQLGKAPGKVGVRIHTKKKPSTFRWLHLG